MSLSLSSCTTKAAVDLAIRNNLDCVVVLRFGQAEETTCLQLDEIVSLIGEKVSVSAAHWGQRIDLLRGLLLWGIFFAATAESVRYVCDRNGVQIAAATISFLITPHL